MLAFLFIERQLPVGAEPAAMMTDVAEAPGVGPQKKRASIAVEAWAIMMIKVVPAIPVLSGKDPGNRVFWDKPDAGHQVLRPDEEGRLGERRSDFSPAFCILGLSLKPPVYDF
jgi:hypothetical protein